MAPAAYRMPLRNTELIPARSPILGELAGLGMRNALMAINSRIVGHSEVILGPDLPGGKLESRWEIPVINSYMEV